MIRLVNKTYKNGKAPPKGIKIFIVKNKGYFGMSLLSLFIFPGFLIVLFLKPINEPSHTFGIDSKQYINNTTIIV